MGDRILIVQDADWRGEDVVKALTAKRWTIKTAGPHEYETVLGLDVPEAVVVAMKSDDTLARRVLERVQQIDDRLPVLVVVAKEGLMREAVDLMKAGAHDVLVSPVETERFERLLDHAVHLFKLTKRVFFLEHQASGWQGRFHDMIGHSTKMQELFQLIRTVAPSNATVLLTGESGVGKELVARALHTFGKRDRHPFMDINCGAIPQPLLENELFGHERGAYTGAEQRYIGCCERADKGSLFLDEICEMEPLLQVKILRLLQERNFMRVGGSERITVDLRFIAATNRDVQKEVEAGRFREDLYYRLNVVPIHIPALRDRPEDVSPLAQHFLEKFAAQMEKPFVDISNEALELLHGYQWPGNVRELENVMERVVVLHNDTHVRAKHLPPNVQKVLRHGERGRTRVQVYGNTESIMPLNLVEKYAIEAALEKCTGNVGEAAKRLKIGQATLYRKIRQYGLRH